MQNPRPIFATRSNRSLLIGGSVFLILFFISAYFSFVAPISSLNVTTGNLLAIYCGMALSGLGAFIFFLTAFRTERIEFYEGSIRVIARVGHPKEFPYSQLELYAHRIHYGNITAFRLSVLGDGQQSTWSVLNKIIFDPISGRSTTLYHWLTPKMGKSDMPANVAKNS